MPGALGDGRARNATLFPRSPRRAAGLFNLAAAAQPHEPGTNTFTQNVPLRARREIPFERLWAGIEFIEGGTGPDGAFRTSPDGAVGPAQVTPRTAPEAARLAGLPWDEHRYRTDAQYNIALGRAYYRRQLRDFHVPEIAAAAYNWGPFALREAIRESKRTGTKLENLMPAETLKYVARFRRYLEDH
jgi:Transglycosylase SLT domain